MAFLNAVMPYVAFLIVCLLFTIPVIWSIFFGTTLMGTVFGVIEEYFKKRKANQSGGAIQTVKARKKPAPWSIFYFKSLVFIAIPVLLAIGLVLYSFNSYQPTKETVVGVALPAPASNNAVDFAAIKGEGVFKANCEVCHQAKGVGVPNVYPPLASSEWVEGPAEILVKIVHNGLHGAITVAGKSFNNVMPPFGSTLSVAEIAAVVNYVQNAWGNKPKNSAIDDKFAQKVVDSIQAKSDSFTPEELKK